MFKSSVFGEICLLPECLLSAERGLLKAADRADPGRLPEDFSFSGLQASVIEQNHGMKYFKIFILDLIPIFLLSGILSI